LLKSGLWRIRPQERKAGRNATKSENGRADTMNGLPALAVWEFTAEHSMCKNSLVVTVMGVV